MYMPFYKGSYQFFVIIYCDLLDWVKIKLLYIFFILSYYSFFQKDIICYYDYFKKFIINKKSENKDAITKLIQRYKVKKVIIVAYYLKINKMIKYDHKLIMDIFLKILNKISIN